MFEKIKLSQMPPPIKSQSGITEEFRNLKEDEALVVPIGNTDYQTMQVRVAGILRDKFPGFKIKTRRDTERKAILVWKEKINV